MFLVLRILPNRSLTIPISLVFLLGCSSDPAPEPVDTSGYAKTEAKVDSAASVRSGPPAISFTDVTDASGVDFVHNTGAFGEKWMPESVASGCILFDYDGDGRLDMLFQNGTFWEGHEQEGPIPTPKLYRNLGAMQFEDVTAAVGLDVPIYGMGGTAGDYDGDGDADLYLTTVSNNVLFRNDGGRFRDVTREAGVGGGQWLTEDGRSEPEWSMSAAWVDVDRDGWIDLFVTNYVQWSPETDLFATFDGKTKSYATPQEYAGLTSRLYRNLGDGRFEDVTERSGVYNPNGKSLGVAVADYDEDGDADIAVANDTQPNFLYRNNGDGTFEDIALTAGVAYDGAGRARAGMGIDIASVDASGALGIAIGNFSRESLSLYVEAGDDLFIDLAGKRRLSTPTLLPLTFGVVFADVDLDGYQDIVCANGHLEPTINDVQKEITYAQRPQLFWNDAGTRYVEVSESAGSGFGTAIVGRGLAFGDLDKDGDIDLVFAQSGGKPIVARNDSESGNVLRVRLVGKAPNTSAIGAAVSVVASGQSRTSMVRTGSSYLSQSEKVLTFGIGSAERIETLTVRWPDGSTRALSDVAINELLTIHEDGKVTTSELVGR